VFGGTTQAPGAIPAEAGQPTALRIGESATPRQRPKLGVAVERGGLEQAAGEAFAAVGANTKMQL
jgi:hypothetical protein